MPSLNKVTLIGHLGKDPEVKYLQNGTTVATVSLATTEKWQAQDGEWKERTEWHNIVAYTKVAEILGEYFKKGNLTYIEGKLHYRSWEKDGVKKYATEIIASTVKNLSPKSKSTQEDSDDEVPF
jgi:single-strand DNA-binding protein